ncbi:MAG: ATP-binding protein [Bacteroidia bacterium]|nr:ATP-binding protein [Bacteroidia bacterium]
MKICSIHIKGFQQFQDTYLDFTDPETGEPAEKICFIGPNGTGKSTILELISTIIRSGSAIKGIKIPYLLVEFRLKNRKIICFYSENNPMMGNSVLGLTHAAYFKENIKNVADWKNKLLVEKRQGFFPTFRDEIIPFLIKGSELDELRNDLTFSENSTDLLIYSPCESSKNSHIEISDVPETNLNHALDLFEHFPYYHIVSGETANEFWRLLVFLIKKREKDKLDLQSLSENQDKTIGQFEKEFDNGHPNILDVLGKIWNKILAPANLEFDIDGAKKPIQLNDNLKAYIKVKSTGNGLQYNQLSTGIRDVIFRIGHMNSLYFNREIKRGFLLVDEPENYLFPNFLYGLIDSYLEMVRDINNENNTQLFMATHSPIIAAQFKPYERIILNWESDGVVTAKKGKAAEGDDPNDLLLIDFNLPQLMQKKGQEMWKEYLNLLNQLRHTEAKSEKMALAAKINTIGRAYNFGENEVSD